MRALFPQQLVAAIALAVRAVCDEEGGPVTVTAAELAAVTGYRLRSAQHGLLELRQSGAVVVGEDGSLMVREPHQLWALLDVVAPREVLVP